MKQELRTDNFKWEDMGETSTAYTTPAVDERDYTNFVTNHPNAVVVDLNKSKWNSYGFRFVTDDDGDAWVVDVFASKGEDYFTRVMTLSLTGGTQVGPATTTDADAVFVDTITKSNENWRRLLDVVDGGGGDRIASIWFDGMGFDTWAFVATTAEAGATLLIQGTGY